jgi:lipoate-protein ligase A
VNARAVVCGEEQRLGPMLCFQHQTAGDLLINGHKVAGSAQRRPHGAMLQHGSILLKRSEHVPELPGIAELSGKNVSGGELEKAILLTLAQSTGWTFQKSDWTNEELENTDRFEREKYASAGWNEKR